MTDDHFHRQDDQREMEQARTLFAEFMKQVDHGHCVDRQLLIDAHPDLAGKLAELFDVADIGRTSDAFEHRPGTDELNGEDETNSLDETITRTVSNRGPTNRANIPDVIGRYHIERSLGSGAFGIVVQAFDRELKRKVAIKISRPAAKTISDKIDSVRSEAQTLAALDHPNIVPVYDVGNLDDGRVYIISKYVDGMDLATRMATDPLTQLEAIQLVHCVAEALHHVHLRGMSHRDIKPSNILITQSGVPMVADFGLAHHQTQLNLRSSVLGTPRYMSPEQAAGLSDLVDGRADIFSLGIVFYELLTREVAFPGSSAQEVIGMIRDYHPRPPRQVDDSIPAELERICLKAMAKNIEQRYSTALDFASDLQSFLADDTEPVQQPATPASSRGWIRWLVAAAVTCSFVSIAMLTCQRLSHDPGIPSEQMVRQKTSVAIDSIDLLHLEDIGDEHLVRGVLGSASFQVRLGDALQLRAVLSRPAYCYWIAFRPDGVAEICYPNAPDSVPELAEVITYPPPDRIGKEVFGLTDGLGVQAFVLLVSENPLPSYRQWSAAHDRAPWKQNISAPAGTIYRIRDNWLDVITETNPDGRRGKGESLHGPPSELQKLVHWFEATNDFKLIELWSFPVSR